MDPIDVFVTESRPVILLVLIREGCRFIIMRFVQLLCLYVLTTAAVSAQSLALFDIDTSAFPVMRAKLHAFDATGQPQRPLASEMSLRENGIPRSLLSVACPPAVVPQPISSLLVIDVSASMLARRGGGISNLDLARAAATSWIQALPQGASQCAISSFDDGNYLLQDFTTDRTKLLASLVGLVPRGTTDYDKGLLLPAAGGLEITRRGRYKKVLVFLTDGMPNRTPRIQDIIDEARLQNCVIYVVTLGMFAPQSLRDISAATRGVWYENVTTVAQAEEAYRRIMYEAQGGGPCEITWQSDVACSGSLRSVEMEWNGVTATGEYLPPINAIAALDIEPIRLYMRSKPVGLRFDTTVTVTAVNAPFTVTGISSSHPAYDCNPKNFVLAKGESRSLTVSYTPPDSRYTWTRFDFSTDICTQEYYASGNYPGTPVARPTLKLDSPNGGEEFVVGNNTVITWSGVPRGDTVTLEYSIDNGMNWIRITDKATGGRYLWQLPRTPSRDCLVRVIHRPDARGGVDIGWARSFGGTNWDVGYDVVVDDSGNVYSTGFFYGTAGFGSDTLKSVGLSDMFVAKQRPDGNYVWVRQAGGTGYEFGHGIDLDSSGNIYVTGSFAKSANIAGNTINGAGASDMFVAKFSSDGSLLWVRHGGGKQDDDGADVVVDASGNVHVTGSFDYTATFDGTTLTSANNSDVFLVTYNSAGGLLSARNDGGPGYDGDFRNSITADVWNNIYVTGYFHDDASFGGNSVSSSGREDLFVAKYRPDNTTEWVERGGGPDKDYGFGVAVDPLGDTYVTGEFKGRATFRGTSVVSAGDADIFLAKYAADGSLAWVRRFGGAGEDRGNNIVIDLDGNPCVTGHFSDGALFGQDTLHCSGVTDLFVATFLPDGSIKSVKQVHASIAATGYGIAVDRSGSLYVTGELVGTGTFGGTLLASQGTQGEVFVWKIGDETVQRDTSDARFSIVMPSPMGRDIDLGKALVGSTKDSLVVDFIGNSGSHPFAVRDIQITGADASLFSLVSGIPPFTLLVGESQPVEFRFQPMAVGPKTAQLLIITSADTLRQTIRGEGVADASMQLTIWPSDAAANPGESVEVAIVLDDSSALAQSTLVRAVLRYNATLLDPIETTPRGTIIGSERVIPLEMPLSARRGNRLALLQFRAMLGDSIATGLTLEGAESVGETIDVRTMSGRFQLLGVCTDGGTRLVRATGEGGILKVRPNPLNGSGDITVRTIESGRTRLVMMDLLGREVAVLHDGELSLGEHLMPLRMENLAAGSYTILLVTPTARYIQRVDLLR